MMDRGWDRVGEGRIRYRFDCIGHGLPTLQPQTILYTLPPSRLVYRGTPLPPAVVKYRSGIFKKYLMAELLNRIINAKFAKRCGLLRLFKAKT